MIAQRRVCDVFLSYSSADWKVARQVARTMEAKGLRVFPPSQRVNDPGKTWSPVNRNAISEARAFVVILTRQSLDSTGILFHFGAALMWNMPVYVLLDGLKKSDVPKALRRASVHALQDLADVVNSIDQKASDILSAEQMKTLTAVYRDVGVPTDELLSNPDALEKLASRFNRAARVDFEPERLLKELIRLRKTRRLPKVST